MFNETRKDEISIGEERSNVDGVCPYIMCILASKAMDQVKTTPPITNEDLKTMKEP
jgi:hypothetical protein